MFIVSPRPIPWPFVAITALSTERRLLTRTFFLARRRRGCSFAALQMMNQCRRDIRRGEALFQQTLNHVILPLKFTALQRGAQLIQKNVRTSFLNLIRGGRLRSLNLRFGVALNVLDLK